MPIPEPSVSTQYGSALVGIARDGADVMVSFNFWNASWHSSVHSNSFLTDVSALRGRVIWAKFCTNRQ